MAKVCWRSWRHSRLFSFCVCAVTAAFFIQSAAAADPKEIYDQSTEALYNLDFNTAERGYETLTREYSDNPEYWNALASSIWLRITYDQQKLNIESFSGSSLGTKESRDTVNPADEKRLRDTVATAIAKADALLKRNPNDVRALYAKGISNATLATFEAMAKRSFVSAGGKAKTARDLHQQVLDLDPTYDDARMAVGAYNYVVAVVPGFIRFLVWPLGIRTAGKDLGIQQIETAAAKGKTTATDARMLLVVVYNREKRYDQALRLVTELHAQYPRNFLFELAKASTYGKMKRWDEAVKTYEQTLAKIQSKKDGYERLRADKVYYALGTSNIELGQLSAAIDAFDQVVKSKGASPDEKARAHLWIGKIYDSQNERPEALQHYDTILALNCENGLKAQAQRYKRYPYKGD